MALEIEAKLCVDSQEPVRQRLLNLRATCLGSVRESNTIFDRPDGWLRERGCGLRVRSVAGETQSPEQPHSGATLTVKGPRRQGSFKSREEIEIHVDDAAGAIAMLKMIGYVPVLQYEKRRESWLLRDCRIELDEPPYIGLFVEIEGPDEEAIRTVQRDIGLAHATHVPDSYVRMLSAYCVKHGIASRVLSLRGCGGTKQV